MRWTLALLPLVAFLALVSTASAARTDTTVVTFPDAHTIDIIVEVYATGTEADGLRQGMDLNHNGVVDGLDLEWDNRCQYSIGWDHVTLRIDNYDARPTFVSCDHESARGTVNSSLDVRIRKTMRAVSPMAETRMLVASIAGGTDVSFSAPAGKEIIQSGDANLPARGTTQIAGTVPPGAPRVAVMRFAHAGQPLDFGYSVSKQHVVTLVEPDVIRQETELVNTGWAAQRLRAQIDADRDGVASPGEVDSDRDLGMRSIPDPILVDGVDRPGAIRSVDLIGATGTVSYDGILTQAYTHETTFALPRDAFRIRDYADSYTYWTFRAPAGRTLTHVSGLTHVQVLDEGARIVGQAAEATWVEVEVSRTLATPATGATEPEPLPPGDWTRTTSVALYDGEAATMRWSISDVRTGAVARDFRTSLDSDADNTVSADERASFEAGVRLVPGPQAWPFTLDGAAPLSTRVHSVDITNLEGAYNDPSDVRTTVVYEATYARSTGMLRASALDYGNRVGVVAPYGEPIDAAGASGLTEVVAGLDGSTLTATPGTSGWSVRIGAAPPASSATGETPAAATCEAPAEPGTATEEWTVTFTEPGRAEVRVVQTRTGAHAAAARRVMDTDRDCVVIQAEADAIAEGNARMELLVNVIAPALDDAPPTAVLTPAFTHEGFVGAANAGTQVRYVRSFVATYDAALPAGLALSARGAQVTITPPSGYVAEATHGFAHASFASGALTGTTFADAAEVRARLLPAAIDATSEAPPLADVAPPLPEETAAGAPEGTPDAGGAAGESPSEPASGGAGGAASGEGTPAETGSASTSTEGETTLTAEEVATEIGPLAPRTPRTVVSPTPATTTAAPLGPGEAPAAVASPGARTPGPALGVLLVAVAALALARKR